MERRKALNPWNSACAKLRKNQGYFLFKDDKGQLTLMMVDSVARAMHESIFMSPFEHYYGNEVSFNGYLSTYTDCHKVEAYAYGAAYNTGLWNGTVDAQVAYRDFEMYIDSLEKYRDRLKEEIEKERKELDKIRLCKCAYRDDCHGCPEFGFHDNYSYRITRNGKYILKCYLKDREVYIDEEPDTIPPSIFNKKEEMKYEK